MLPFSIYLVPQCGVFLAQSHSVYVLCFNIFQMLLWDLAGAFHFHGVSFGLENILVSLFFRHLLFLNCK